MTTDATWNIIEECGDINEAALQRIFDDWSHSCGGWRMAGTPEWLTKLGGENLAKCVSLAGYRFTPDVLWDGKCFAVIELKHSPKYEEIALVEVLHHAWHLCKSIPGNAAPCFPLPILITSYSAWMRGALAYLFAHGLRKDSLRYLEATFLTDAGKGRFLWLYEPFADWIPSEDAPCCHPRSSRGENPRWHRLTQSAAWVATDGDPPQRPITPDPSLFIARMDDNEHQYLSWNSSDGRYQLSSTDRAVVVAD